MKLYQIDKKISRKILKKTKKTLKIKNITPEIDTLRGFITGKTIQYILNNKQIFQKHNCKNNEIIFKIKGTAAALKIICKRSKEGFYSQLLGLKQYEKKKTKEGMEAIEKIKNSLKITSVDFCIDKNSIIFPQNAKIKKNIRNQTYYFEAFGGLTKIYSYNKTAKERKNKAKLVKNTYRLEARLDLKEKGVKTLKRNKKINFKPYRKKRIYEGMCSLISLIKNSKQKQSFKIKQKTKKISKKEVFALKSCVKKIKITKNKDFLRLCKKGMIVLNR